MLPRTSRRFAVATLSAAALGLGAVAIGVGQSGSGSGAAGPSASDASRLAPGQPPPHEVTTPVGSMMVPDGLGTYDPATLTFVASGRGAAFFTATGPNGNCLVYVRSSTEGQTACDPSIRRDASGTLSAAFFEDRTDRRTEVAVLVPSGYDSVAVNGVATSVGSDRVGVVVLDAWTKSPHVSTTGPGLPAKVIG